MKRIVISGADASYWPLLSGMLRSIEPHIRREHISVGILDVGLTASQRDRLHKYGAAIIQPGWDYPIENFSRPRTAASGQ
jgi:hypothetical protein